MEVLAKKIVSQWVKQGLVEESQAEWYVYGLLERLTTLCTFCVVVTLGSLVSTIWQSILFAIALMYLRAYTNGHHAKSYLSCLINSCVIELLGVFLCNYFTPVISLCLAIGSSITILLVAPINNEQIHFSEKELAAVRTVCHKRLAILFVLHILGLLRTLDANLNTTGTPNDGNQLENKLSALNEELDDLVSQRASRSITMDDFLSKSTEINNEIINVEGLLQSSIQEQRPKARLDMHSIEAALSDDASFPDGKIEPGFLDRYANRIVKSNNRYIWMLQLMNVQQIMPIQSERQPIAMVTYKSGVPYDIEQEQIGKQDKESAGPDCATICRPQDFFLNMSRTKRKRKLVEWLESCQENQVSVLDEKIPLLSFAVDFVTAYEYQKARGIKIHPGLWKDMRVDIFLVKKEN